MKLRNKVLAGFAVSVLALSLMVGSAFAVAELPATYDKAANGTVAEKTQDNDVWIKVTGGGKIYGTPEIAKATKSVDVTFSGKATGDITFIYNCDGGWKQKPAQKGVAIDGDKVINFEMDGSLGPNYCEAVINVANKTEGELAVTKMEFKDEAGKVILTVPAAAEAPAADAKAADTKAADAKAADTKAADTTAAATDVPKTGVVSAALVLGLGTVLFGSGAVVLKKRER